MDREIAIACLKKYFGHESFRPGQEPLIEAILSGRDVLGVMPTGAGKSVCYQIPALLMDGLALVVSPLISLMKDQVAALRAAGIKAAVLNSSLTPAQQQQTLRCAESGGYQLIYVTPERLLTDSFLRFATAAGPCGFHRNCDSGGERRYCPSAFIAGSALPDDRL